MNDFMTRRGNIQDKPGHLIAAETKGERYTVLGTSQREMESIKPVPMAQIE